MNPSEFISRWQGSGGAELANSQSFLKELCALLDVPQPEPTAADESRNAYAFEKAVEFNNGDGTTSSGRVDLYRRGAFVLESKQGADRKDAEQAEILATVTKQKKHRSGTALRGTAAWEQAMVKARQQARRYAEAMPDEWPPFLIVADVGHCFDLYADFTQSGKNYIPFPDPQSYRIPLADLADEAVREKFRAIWLNPLALDPSRRTAKVTREVAQRLARLAKSLEGQATPDVVAQFLMRCLFTMFAEDIEIGGLKKGDFTRLLTARRGKPQSFVPMLEQLWREMNTGGFSVILEGTLKQFNGGLFEDQTALPVNEDQLELLIEAAEAQWNDVEPAIFGTLLERALDPVERHKLGAHYTPRAYVERLVMPTIIEPLREQWDTAYATAVAQYEEGQAADAVKTVRRFHEQLCETRVLDPACGSGNFLYVALELMKRLEGEVLKALRDFGDHQKVLLTITPHQFLGIEVNPRAAAIADLVLWIGYLQWHFRTRGDTDLSEPIIRKFHNIECRDAVLDWDRLEPVVDNSGKPVTRWDGRTTKPHPVTGEEVPDETAQVQELRYINPRKAEWPKTDYIVGNPPFIGGWKLRHDLGDGYTDALWEVNTDIPNKADYVMYWWNEAARIVTSDDAFRFGFITTNSIRMEFNRRIVRTWTLGNALLSLRFVVPDHPWVDSTDGADVRISMTVGDSKKSGKEGALCSIIPSDRTKHAVSGDTFETLNGIIQSNLTIGPDLDTTLTLQANQGLSFAGVKLHGAGFVLQPVDAERLRQTYSHDRRFIRPYMNGRDFAQRARGASVIDLYGMTVEDARTTCPEVLDWVIRYVKPERDQNRDQGIRENWWLHGRTRGEMRAAMISLTRYIATPETAKHRMFTFLSEEVLPDNKLITVVTDDAFILGVLSSQIHGKWALPMGGRLGVGNDPVYQNLRCFDRFPFPDPDDATMERIRELGEQLDAHRKRQQELHPDLTMTGMYNVLEKLRSGEALTTKERTIHEQGLVSVLKQIHDDLDAAVTDAYGWPHDLSDEEILQRLVELNHERAAEEAREIVRWLRPEFQNPAGAVPTQTQLEIAEDEVEVPVKPATAKRKKESWPSALPDRIRAVRTALATHHEPVAPSDLAQLFTRARAAVVEELLDTLVAVGQARQTDDGRYVA